jgi:hypothetical protein
MTLSKVIKYKIKKYYQKNKNNDNEKDRKLNVVKYSWVLTSTIESYRVLDQYYYSKETWESRAVVSRGNLGCNSLMEHRTKHLLQTGKKRKSFANQKWVSIGQIQVGPAQFPFGFRSVPNEQTLGYPSTISSITASAHRIHIGLLLRWGSTIYSEMHIQASQPTKKEVKQLSIQTKTHRHGNQTPAVSCVYCYILNRYMLSVIQLLVYTLHIDSFSL